PEGRAVPLKPQMEIPSGSRIHVKERSRLNLLMSDGAIEKLGADTVFAFEQYEYDPTNPRATLIRKTLHKGEITSTTGAGGESAKERYRLNSPLAAIAVLGTEYTVRANQGETWITVHAGAISIAKFGNGCLPSGLGACSGGTLLSEAQQGLALVVNAEQPHPVLVPVSALPITKTEDPPAAQTADTASTKVTDKPADKVAEKKPEKTADIVADPSTTKAAENVVEKKSDTTATKTAETVMETLPETTATVAKAVEKVLEKAPVVATASVAEVVIPTTASEKLPEIPVTPPEVTLASTPSVSASTSPTALAQGQGANTSPITNAPSRVSPVIVANTLESSASTALANSPAAESLPTVAISPAQNRTPVKAPPASTKSPKVVAVAALPTSSRPSESPESLNVAETPKPNAVTSASAPVAVAIPQPVISASTVPTIIDWGKYHPTTPVSASGVVLSEHVAQITQQVIQPSGETTAQDVKPTATAPTTPNLITPPPTATSQETPVETALPPTATSQETPVETALPPTTTSQETPVKTLPPAQVLTTSPAEPVPVVAAPAGGAMANVPIPPTPSAPGTVPDPAPTTAAVSAPNPILTATPLSVESTEPLETPTLLSTPTLSTNPTLVTPDANLP
ncbi:MAG: FecR domain-containing protein, partial [Thiothrix sp.]